MLVFYKVRQSQLQEVFISFYQFSSVSPQNLMIQSVLNKSVRAYHFKFKSVKKKPCKIKINTFKLIDFILCRFHSLYSIGMVAEINFVEKDVKINLCIHIDHLQSYIFQLLQDCWVNKKLFSVEAATM